MTPRSNVTDVKKGCLSGHSAVFRIEVQQTNISNTDHSESIPNGVRYEQPHRPHRVSVAVHSVETGQPATKRATRTEASIRSHQETSAHDIVATQQGRWRFSYRAVLAVGIGFMCSGKRPQNRFKVQAASDSMLPSAPRTSFRAVRLHDSLNPPGSVAINR